MSVPPVRFDIDPDQVEIARERARAGIAVLQDVLGPGFWHDLDILDLDVRSTCGCVLGQLYRDAPEPTKDQAVAVFGYSEQEYEGYERGRVALAAHVKHPGEFGFDLMGDGDEVEWSALQEAWMIELRALREGAHA